MLFNRNYPAGNWLFFPVSLAVKTNIALVLLAPLGLIFLFFTRKKWREGMFLLIPAIVFFIFASLSTFHQRCAAYPADIRISYRTCVGRRDLAV